MKLKNLISGENINLCEPNEQFALESDWHSWFNDSRNTEYLDQIINKITPKDQLNYFLSIKNRLIFIIQEKNNNYFIGYVSLSNINSQKKTCEISILKDFKKNKFSHFLSSLEAIFLITEYAFEKLGMRIVYAAQHINLAKWQNQMELAGYKLEGVHEKKFYKFKKESDLISIGCHIDDFNFLKKKRGKYWDGNVLMFQRYKKLLKIEKFLDKCKKFINTEKKKYYKKIFDI